MAKAKYIISFFLFLSVFLIIGESYNFYLDNFQDDYISVHYYLETGDSTSEMNATIFEQAKLNDINVFAIEKINNGPFESEIVVYGDEEVVDILKSDWGITNDLVHSFFSGTTVFEFNSFDQASEKVMSYCYYANASYEQVYNMVYPNLVEYSGSIQSLGSITNANYIVVGIFSIVLFFMILLTAYDLSYNKKEYCVQILHGRSVSKIINTKIVIDLIGIVISILLSFMFSSLFTTSSFKLITSVLCILFILVINSIVIYLYLKKIKPIQLKEKTNDKNLYYSMMLKIIISIAMILTLSSVLLLSMEGWKFYNQKDYYNSQEDMVHIDIKYPYDYSKFEIQDGYFNPVEQVVDNFISYSYKFLDCSLMYYQSYKDIAPLYGDKYVYANLNGVSKYKNDINDYDTLVSNEGNYLLIPDNVNVNDVLNELPSITGLSKENITGVITYSDGLSIIAEGRLDIQLDYSYDISNPIILLDTYDYGNLDNYSVSYCKEKEILQDGIIYNNSSYLYQFISVKKDEVKINEYPSTIEGEVINSSLVEIEVTDISVWFEGLWQLQNRSLLISIVLVVLLFILEIQTSILVLRMYYETNSRELTIKKILGYTILDRFMNVFKMVFISFVGTLVISIVLSMFYGIGVLQLVFISGVIICLFDILLLLFLIVKTDKSNIQKVLKGGI